LASKNRQIENKNVELIPLTSKKLVQPTDYLLCIRGIPTGYSVMRSLKKLSKFPEFKNFAAAATHHFVIFKLRENYAHMNVQFIHLILDSIVKNDMLELYNKKRKVLEERKRGEDEPNISPVVITSIKEIKMSDIRISINSTSLRINTELYTKFNQVEVYNATGSLVYSELNGVAANTNVSASFQRNTIYFVRLKTNDRTFTFKTVSLN
jgi:hypothetical protein